MARAGMTLDQLKQLMRAAEVTQLYVKRLATNDNSKQQVYLGLNLTALNILPNGPLIANPAKPTMLKSALHFSWLTSTGSVVRAAGAQLILYPEYPEVRFSGFLRGCSAAPSELMTARRAGRLLFFGVTPAGHILGFAAGHDSALAREVDALALQPDIGVFSRIALEFRTDDRKLLISELARIVGLGWINSKRLNKTGDLMACPASNCGGYTLEAELGIRPNGYADPDFHGWEIKQHAVPKLTRPTGGGPITLMTPEPTGGVYVKEGVQEFMRRYGYADRTAVDRRNFGGIHTAIKLCAKTKLQLMLDGYDVKTNCITDFTKGITLFDVKGDAAAVWHYQDLLGHWTHKHALAAYIPSNKRTAPSKQYRYGNLVRLGEGTEFRLFLNAVSTGAIYYDPGIKVLNASAAKPKVKRRSQFRIKSASIPALYTKMTEVDVAEG